MSSRLKILCLHGYSMNGQWLQEWVSPLQNVLAHAEFFYPDAPLHCSAEQVNAIWKKLGASIPSKRLGAGLNLCWFYTPNQGPMRYRNIEYSFDHLNALATKNNGFDVVLGWSQGALMTSLWLDQLAPEHMPKCVVLGGGVEPRDESYRHIITHPLQLPSLHLLASRDVDYMQKRAKKLMNCFENPDYLTNAVPHCLPLQLPGQSQKVADWIMSKI